MVMILSLLMIFLGGAGGTALIACNNVSGLNLDQFKWNLAGGNGANPKFDHGGGGGGGGGFFASSSLSLSVGLNVLPGDTGGNGQNSPYVAPKPGRIELGLSPIGLSSNRFLGFCSSFSPSPTQSLSISESPSLTTSASSSSLPTRSASITESPRSEERRVGKEC